MTSAAAVSEVAAPLAGITEIIKTAGYDTWHVDSFLPCPQSWRVEPLATLSIDVLIPTAKTLIRVADSFAHTDEIFHID